MSPELKYEIARVLNHILLNEEEHYEYTVHEFGKYSNESIDHIYNVARNLWVELELDGNHRKQGEPYFTEIVES